MIVEDGFLDGLDLRFSDGLNVLIGARGTGKTSIVELL
jgi:recombinational DNA repair ATPase RecF